MQFVVGIWHQITRLCNLPNIHLTGETYFFIGKNNHLEIWLTRTCLSACLSNFSHIYSATCWVGVAGGGVISLLRTFLLILKKWQCAFSRSCFIHAKAKGKCLNIYCVLLQVTVIKMHEHMYSTVVPQHIYASRLIAQHILLSPTNRLCFQ